MRKGCEAALVEVGLDSSLKIDDLFLFFESSSNLTLGLMRGSTWEEHCKLLLKSLFTSFDNPIKVVWDDTWYLLLDYVYELFY